MKSLQPKVVRFDSADARYVRLLGGPPDTVAMRSGLVTLKPAESVGEHTTGPNEEAIVVLDGTGEFSSEKGETLSLTTGSIAYCPPHTLHNVTNTGTLPLRYVYVVARAVSNGNAAMPHAIY